MNKKQYIGVVILLLGVLMLAYANHSKGKVESAREEVGLLTNPFSSNSTGRFAKHSAEHKFDHYDLEIRWLYIGGIALVIAGAAATYICRRH